MNRTRPVERSGRGHAIVGGLVAGMIGGAAIANLMLVATLANGQDIWTWMKLAGAPLLGDRALQPGFDLLAILVGVTVHFLISAVWGALFGFVFYGLRTVPTVVAGAFYGIAVWLAMFYIVLPIVGTAQLARSAPIQGALFQHVLFGLAVGVGFLPFQEPRHAPPPRRRSLLST